MLSKNDSYNDTEASTDIGSDEDVEISSDDGDDVVPMELDTEDSGSFSETGGSATEGSAEGNCEAKNDSYNDTEASTEIVRDEDVENSSDDGVDVVPMKSEDAEIELLDLSGDIDAEDILAKVLEYLHGAEKELTEEEAPQMEVDGDSKEIETEIENSLPADQLKNLKSLWDYFCVTLDTTKPVMCGDPKVDALVTSVKDQIEIFCVDPTLENTQILSEEVDKLLKQLRPVDLDLLLSLMTQVSEAGKTMEGKNVLLLLGATGAGKTTTVLHFAGATFTEDLVDGFPHLQPENLPDLKLKQFHTSCSTNSVTSALQCFEVQVGDETVVLCDVPGIGDTGGVEVEISNGFGMVRSIHQANSVKPVLVLSKDGMGDRFSAVSDVLDTITKLLGGTADPKVLEAFAYLFTKCDKKFEKLLWQQFNKARREKKGIVDSASFRALLDDVITKTKPLAQILSPLDGDGKEELAKLWDDTRLDPKDSLSPFVPKASEDLLRLQLQYSVTNLEQAMKGKRFQSAQKTFKRLQLLSRLLPDFKAPFEQALATCIACLSEMHDKVSLSVSKFKNVLEHNTFAEDLRQLELQLTELHEFEMVRANFLPTKPPADEIRSGAILDVMSAVRVRLVESGDDMDSETFLANIARALDEMGRLNIIRETFPHDLEAQSAYRQCAMVLLHGATRCTQLAESYLADLPTKLEQLCQLYEGWRQLNAYLGEHCYTEDAKEVLTSLQRMWRSANEQLQHKAERSVDALAAMQADIAEHIRNRVMVVLDVSSQKINRAFLVELAEATCLCNNLPILLAQNVNSATGSFDAQVKIYFEHLSRCLMEALNDKQDFDQLSFDESLQKQQKAVDFLEVFVDAESQLRNFRRWSRKIEEETYAVWMQLNEIQPELHRYKSDVKASLEKLEKEGEAIVCEAKSFLQRLKSPRENASLLLQELSDKKCWEKWEHTLQRKSKLRQSRQTTKTSTWSSFTSFTFTGLFGLGKQATTVEQGGKTESETTLDEILCWFRQRIRIALRSICIAAEEEQLEDLPHKLLDQKLGSISLWIVFLHLTQKKCSFGEAILKEPGISEEVMKAELSPARALDGIKNVCAIHLRNKSFQKIESVLQLFAGCSDTMNQMRHLQSIPATSHHRRSLIESISSFPTHGVLSKNAIVAAMVLKRDFRNFSFLDEPRLKTGNEQDRLSFYRMVLSLLVHADEASCLEGHAGSEQMKLDVISLHNECCQHVLTETKKYGVQVSQLLMAFPDNVADFKELNVGVENLGSMSHVFSGAKEQNVAELSQSLMRDAERILAGRLSAFVDSLNPNKPEDLLQPLLRLKSAATDMHRWNEKINKAIDRTLLESPNGTEKAGRFVLNLAAELDKISNSKDHVGAPIAKKLLAEHKCFGFAMNAVFNDATAKQDIGWVVEHLQVSKEGQKQLKAMHDEFSREYKDIVVAGLKATVQNRLDEFLSSLCSEANVIAEDLSMEYETQIVLLTAHVFGFWTLCDAKEMAVVGRTATDEGNDSMNHLKKPHPAQVVAVWMMLNYKERENQSLQNQLCEVWTGEGKSIVLGVTATILAMMGCEIDCICCSSYLSERDLQSFEEMFLRFGCNEHINCNTVDDLVRKLIGGIWKLGENVLLNKPSRGGCSGSSDRLRVLLIDEVDVLFKKEFFGNSFNPVVSCEQEHLCKLALFIWDNLKCIGESDVIQFREAMEFLGQFPADVHPLIKAKLREMVEAANRVSCGMNVDYFVKNGDICYKKFDGFISGSKSSKGFETLFAHAKEHRSGNITREAMEWKINLGIQCGMFSYAELPVNFDVILGVTGTLKGLRQAEKDTLQSMYDLKNFAYVPSVCGQNKLQFAADDSRDVLLCDSNDEHNYEIAAEIERRGRPVNGEATVRRPVMVFFRTKKALQAFNKSNHAQRLKATFAVQTITEEVDPEEKEGLFGKATEAGVVSLLIREFGRGTDFKCYDNKVLAAGGVHVIQAFYSTDGSEFIQMKGRAASMVLSPKDLREDLQISADDIDLMKNQSTRCAFLDKRRESNYEKEHQQLLKKVEEAKNMHHRSMAFIEAARINLRKEALDFLFEVNLITGRFDSAFAGNGTKERFVEERKRRVEEHNKRQREHRRTQRIQMETNPPEDPPSPLLLAAEDTCHCSVLGISRDATDREIVRAFRRLALACHPDRNDDENAATLFRRIQGAKEVLLCDQARAAYDRSLD